MVNVINCLIKVIFVANIVILFGGCSTVSSKVGVDREYGVNVGNQWGHPYSGLTENISQAECFPAFIYYTLGLALIFYPLDTITSAIYDTLILPMDLMIEPDYPRAEIDWSDGNCFSIGS